MRKLLLVLVLSILVVSFSLSAEYLNKTTNQDGQSLISVVNDTDNFLTCQIYNTTYYVDFTIAPNSSSRWYIEPNSNYQWDCH